MPRGGGAIQFANFPGSTTRPISDATNARSDSLGSQRSTFAFHAAWVMTCPPRSIFAADNGPILRLNALWGTLNANATPCFCRIRFQRSTPAVASRMKSSRKRSFSALSAGASTVTRRSPCTSRSEEHTSELQSRRDLVCRLLLEKKNLLNNTFTNHLPSQQHNKRHSPFIFL